MRVRRQSATTWHNITRAGRQVNIYGPIYGVFFGVFNLELFAGCCWGISMATDYCPPQVTISYSPLGYMQGGNFLVKI